jgi:hypothetical protein
VNWPGVKKNITCAQVLEFSAGRFFLGDEWIREAQVPYTGGDECYLVLFHTPLFTFVRPLALLIFNYLTYFVCFCNKQAFTSRLDRGSKNGHELMMKNPEVRLNA